MGTTGRQTKEKLNVGSPNFCIRGPFKNLSLDRSKLLVLNDQHLVVVAWQTLIGQFKTSHITRIPSFTAVSTVYDKKAFNILTLILVWSRGDHGRPAWNCNLSLFYFPTKHTQVYTVELATFLSDFLFNCFFFLIFPCTKLLTNSLECKFSYTCWKIYPFSNTLKLKECIEPLQTLNVIKSNNKIRVAMSF